MDLGLRARSKRLRAAIRPPYGRSRDRRMLSVRAPSRIGDAVMLWYHPLALFALLVSVGCAGSHVSPRAGARTTSADAGRAVRRAQGRARRPRGPAPHRDGRRRVVSRDGGHGQRGRDPDRAGRPRFGRQRGRRRGRHRVRAGGHVPHRGEHRRRRFRRGARRRPRARPRLSRDRARRGQARRVRRRRGQAARGRARRDPFRGRPGERRRALGAQPRGGLDEEDLGRAPGAVDRAGRDGVAIDDAFASTLEGEAASGSSDTRCRRRCSSLVGSRSRRERGGRTPSSPPS